MPLTLTVSTPGDPPATSDYSFDVDRVTIGRGGESTLVLPDTRRVVSKEHAAVIRSGQGYDLLDLGSKNQTFFKGEPLEPGRAYPLQSGDTFTIGEFTLTAAIRAGADGERTMLDGGFINPFLDDAAVLGATLRSMAKTYEMQPTARRDDAIVEAIRAAIAQADQGPGSPVMRLVGTTFGGGSAEPAPALPSPGAAVQGPTDAMLEAMSRALARALAIPQRFRHEFIGQTIVQGPEASPMVGGDALSLRRHLTEAPDADEAARRAERLQEAADTLALHHVALLEGYRAAVREGAANLLQALDPALPPSDEPSFIEKVLPFTRRLRAAGDAARRWTEQKGEDWAVAERRIFRPAFIKAYLQRAEPDERRVGDTGSGVRRLARRDRGDDD
jgi:predicted component of type VI protein secretion system